MPGPPGDILSPQTSSTLWSSLTDALGTSPLHEAVLACGIVAGVCWLLSVVTREHSWVDRIWSIAPPCYVLWFWSQTGFADLRLGVMTLVSVLWGARLTFNFARKGGYARGGEDYRWAELRTRMSPALFHVFNVVFISLYQNVLLLLFVLPAWRAWVAWHSGGASNGTSDGSAVGALDVVAAALFLVLLVLETVTDQEQWRFHQEKKAKAARGEVADPPFATRGLFRFSRHPNFFCEQAMWWCFYLFSVAATGVWLHPTLLGAVLLSLLFDGSTRFTESLTLRKYPAYAAYQRRTSRLIPLPPRRA